MLNRLYIRRFRGFQDVEIAELGRLNLVAGANNVGKTTLLEAVFLLSGAANARMAVNGHVIRDQDQGTPPRSWANVYWKPLFAGLNTKRPVMISGHHSRVGEMKLKISWGRKLLTEIPREGHERGRSHEQSLKFRYTDDQRSGPLESEVRETAENSTSNKNTSIFRSRPRFSSLETEMLMPMLCL